MFSTAQAAKGYSNMRHKGYSNMRHTEDNMLISNKVFGEFETKDKVSDFFFFFFACSLLFYHCINRLN